MGVAVTNNTRERQARRALQKRRRALMTLQTKAENESRALLAEREVDWEDRAANLAAAQGLDRLGDEERAQLQTVTDALERLDDGTWGWCLSCRDRISDERLRVCPEATRCTTCMA